MDILVVPRWARQAVGPDRSHSRLVGAVGRYLRVLVRQVADGGEAQARVREAGPLRRVGVPGGAHELVGPGRAALGRLHAVAALHVPHHLRQRLRTTHVTAVRTPHTHANIGSSHVTYDSRIWHSPERVYFPQEYSEAPHVRLVWKFL